MADKISFRMDGLKLLQTKLKQLPEAIQNEVKQDIEDAADTIVMKASQRAPVDLGVLKQSIANEPRAKGLSYIVYVGAEYGPYVEFGIGSGVNVPAALTTFAAQWKGKNPGGNMPARPFFFPAYFEEREKLMEKLKAHIKKHL